MSTQISDVTRPENISDRVWEDFVRVHINGERPKDVAEGRASATVSANVKRIREKLGLIESDAAPRQNGESTAAPVETGLSDEDKYALADELLPPFGRMYVHERERIEANAPSNKMIEKCEDALQKAQDALAEAQAQYEKSVETHSAQMTAFEEAAQASGFDFDAYNEKVAEAQAALEDETSAETPTA